MTNTMQQEARTSEPTSLRHRWPRGPFGWCSYVFDHRLRGYERPVDWNAMWAWEQTGHGLAVFANGGALVLLGVDVDVFRLAARGHSDADVASHLQITERKVQRLRHAFDRHLGAPSAADLARIASSYPQLQ